MAGLVGYASSDEGDEDENQEPIEAPAQAHIATAAESAPTDHQSAPVTSVASHPKEDAVAVGPVQQNAVPLGPSLPPVDEPFAADADSSQAPASPYSANRSLLQDLTLPSVPDLDIPPSPPGSPPPRANKRFEEFLELKKQGVHFNAKLEQSSALKNPSVMDKLMDFVELDGVRQYQTTLPAELWDPNGFPAWAFRHQMRSRAAAKEKEKEREKGKSSGGRTAIDFVPSTTSAASAGGNKSAGGGLSRGEKRKGGWK